MPLNDRYNKEFLKVMLETVECPMDPTVKPTPEA